MQKKLIAGIIAVLAVAAAILIFVNRQGDTDRSGLVLIGGGKESTVAWEDIEARAFDGDLVNGKGEISHHEYTGAELSSLLRANGIEITDSSVITAASEDNYSAQLSGAELLEAGKVYVALSDGGEQIEGIDGVQGAKLIVFGDPNSKRAVKYLKTITVE